MLFGDVFKRKMTGGNMMALKQKASLTHNLKILKCAKWGSMAKHNIAREKHPGTLHQELPTIVCPSDVEEHTAPSFLAPRTDSETMTSVGVVINSTPGPFGWPDVLDSGPLQDVYSDSEHAYSSHDEDSYSQYAGLRVVDAFYRSDGALIDVTPNMYGVVRFCTVEYLVMFISELPTTLPVARPGQVLFVNVGETYPKTGGHLTVFVGRRHFLIQIIRQLSNGTPDTGSSSEVGITVESARHEHHPYYTPVPPYSSPLRPMTADGYSGASPRTVTFAQNGMTPRMRYVNEQPNLPDVDGARTRSSITPIADPNGRVRTSVNRLGHRRPPEVNNANVGVLSARGMPPELFSPDLSSTPAPAIKTALGLLGSAIPPRPSTERSIPPNMSLYQLPSRAGPSAIGKPLMSAFDTSKPYHTTPQIPPARIPGYTSSSPKTAPDNLAWLDDSPVRRIVDNFIATASRHTLNSADSVVPRGAVTPSKKVGVIGTPATKPSIALHSPSTQYGLPPGLPSHANPNINQVSPSAAKYVGDPSLLKNPGIARMLPDRSPQAPPVFPKVYMPRMPAVTAEEEGFAHEGTSFYSGTTMEAVKNWRLSLDPLQFLNPFASAETGMASHHYGPDLNMASVDLKMITPELIEQGLVKHRKRIAGQTLIQAFIDPPQPRAYPFKIAFENNIACPRPIHSIDFGQMDECVREWDLET